jgi:hypothetical protein
LHKNLNAVVGGTIAFVPSFDSAWFAQSGVGRQVAIVIGLAMIAIIALLVAGAAHLRDQHHRARITDDEDLFTTTPLPMPKEELARLKRESPIHGFKQFGIPRWLQVGSLLAAVVVTWVVAQRVAPGNGQSRQPLDSTPAMGAARDRDAEESPEDLDLVPDSSPTFVFRVRDWVVSSGGGCAGRLEVTKGESNAWTLLARVHDNRGQLIDTARARVPALRQGDVVEFTFPRADCDRIGAWDVSGVRRPQ